MSNSQSEPKISPPRYIAALAAGFNTVASHIYLVLFPIAIDLFLWFGPMVRIRDIFAPTLEQSLAAMAGSSTPEAVEIVKQSQALWAEILAQFNLFSMLRAFPVGIPSLLAFQGAASNPLGSLRVFDLNNTGVALSFIIATSLLGIAAGALYFTLIAKAVSQEIDKLTPNVFASHLAHSIQLTLMTLAVVAFAILPMLCAASFLLLLVPQLGSIPLIVVGMLLIWMAVPVIFTPHGMFSSGMAPGVSLRFSYKLVRQYLPGTSTFILLAILISYGLNFLWTTPQPSQWLLGVGIIGHAFITTGVLAATFVYYKGGVEWMNEIIRLRAAQQKPPEAS